MMGTYWVPTTIVLSSIPDTKALYQKSIPLEEKMTVNNKGTSPINDIYKILVWHEVYTDTPVKTVWEIKHSRDSEDILGIYDSRAFEWLSEAVDRRSEPYLDITGDKVKFSKLFDITEDKYNILLLAINDGYIEEGFVDILRRQWFTLSPTEVPNDIWDILSGGYLPREGRIDFIAWKPSSTTGGV